ncbi:MAG: 2-oxoacid:ferredoxin oxidoreductase subunit gamma [Candidatus Lokiarchaeota archaeon]|nr:2-oxoacid:ferredoxin oxidoreductase subunit gamma [Candidatus Lokiarchaeota archaeon]MBD3339151.1 2-oxoacid:ferredoxin oxidoreductase subunit gamma [Candidatus Lokiarchaeota archaeon]
MNSGKLEKNEISVRICGAGGQGVILFSVLLGKSAIYDNLNAIQTQSYGAEQRGTKVHSDVIISHAEVISYPVIEKADVLVAFAQDAYNFYSEDTASDVLIIINSNMVQVSEDKGQIFKIPATELASELGNKRVANVIMYGALLKKLGKISTDAAMKSITDTVPKAYREINIKAFNKGYEYNE